MRLSPNARFDLAMLAVVLAILFFLCKVLLMASPAWADNQIDNPQTVSYTGTPNVANCPNLTPVGSATTCATQHAPTAGNILIVFSATAGTTITQTITSNNGTCTPHSAQTGQNSGLVENDCTVTATAATTITDTLSSGNGLVAITVWEVSGTNGFDVSGGVKNGSLATGVTAGTTSNTTQASDYCVAGLSFASTVAKTPTVGPGGTSGSPVGNAWVTVNNDTTIGPGLLTASEVLGGTGLGAIATWSWSGTTASTGITACYKSAVTSPITPTGTPASSVSASGTSDVVTAASTTGTTCNRIAACTQQAISNMACSGNGCTCTVKLGPTGLNGSTANGTKYELLCTGCTGNPTCTWTTTATVAFNVDAFTGGGAATCATDGTGSADTTGTGTTLSSASMGSLSAGDMLLFDTCSGAGTPAFSNPQPLNTNATITGNQFASRTANYPVTAPSVAPTQSITAATGVWAVGAVSLQAATATLTPTPSATPTISATPSTTPTISATPTATPTTSATVSATPSATPTSTAAACNNPVILGGHNKGLRTSCGVTL